MLAFIQPTTVDKEPIFLSQINLTAPFMSLFEQKEKPLILRLAV